MPKALTVKTIEQAKPGAARREIPDGLLTGLYFIVQPSGARSWAVRYRHSGKPRKLTLGAYPVLSLSEAREEARAALRTVAHGDDPAATKLAKRKAPADGIDRDLVRNVVVEFIERHAKKNRSWPEVERMFKHDVLPVWGDRRIQEITRRDVIGLLDGLTDRGIGTMANRVFSIVRKLFNWAIARDMIAASPCAGLKAPVPEVSRDRVLSDDEIRWFWSATDQLGFPFGPLFKLLLATGQRLSEVGEMTTSELKPNERIWTIPRERAKNNAAHEVPLSELSVRIVAETPRISGQKGLLFTTTGETPASGFSRAKANLDRAMLAAAQAEGVESIPGWRLHDLRRTAASGMARLGINLPVIEKVLNHTSGSFAGIVGVYQRHSFSDEKRAALETWARFIERLTSTPASNVIELRTHG
jgi:integrase